MQKNLLSFLVLFFLTGLFVGLLDLIKILLLLVEKNLSILDSVVQVEVLSAFIRLEVKVVKQFDETLVELSDFNLRRNGFNLTLNDTDFTVLLGNNLLLVDKLLIFGFKFVIDLLKDSSLLFLFELLSADTHTF